MNKEFWKEQVGLNDLAWKQKNMVENLIYKTKPYPNVETGSGRALGSEILPEIILIAENFLRQTGCADVLKKLKRRAT